MFSHLDSGGQPAMVDTSGKAVTARSAHARARVWLPEEVRRGLEGGELRSPKGPVFQTAIIAGTMAAKRTHELIPFCHPLGLEACNISIHVEDSGHAVINCVVRVTHRTGVEMEALTGAGIAALTIYDMCKSLSHDMVVSDLRLIGKSGGKSDYRSPGAQAP